MKKGSAKAVPAGKRTAAEKLQYVKKNWQLYVFFLLPALLLTIIFKYVPMGGVLIAFEDYNVIDGVFGSKWVGLEYFRRFLASPDFMNYLVNTLKLSIYGLLWGFPIPIILALLLNQIRRAGIRKKIQLLIYAPNFISVIVLCGMVRMFLSPVGPLNKLIGSDANWMTMPAAFRTIYIASGIWQTAGWASIMYTAALANASKDLEEAEEGVKTIMLDKKFGTAGNEMVIEEFMTGREVSVLSFVDGNTIKTMTSAQDHKRAGDGDTGLNTGGMGTFSPSPFYTEEVDEFCKKYVYQPTVDAMKAEGRPFKGVIFFGLMLTADGPKVLEYNARFGDPEAQVVLPRMKNDIIDVVEACIDGTLDQIDLQFEDNAAVCVVLASDGYPVKYDKGLPISGLDEFGKHEGYYCFHAGTKFNGDQIVTNGGRVLGVTAKGKDLKEARANAYAATEWVKFDNKYMRHDIGKAIDEA